MLPPRLEPIIGEDGVERWNALVAGLVEGPLYHGTSLGRARRIMDEGFRARIGYVAADGQVMTYWGRRDVAASFACKWATLDNEPPAIIQASLDDVLASGTPMPLRTDIDNCDIEYPSWRECHADTGQLWVLGGRHVRGLILHATATTEIQTSNSCKPGQ